MYRMSNSEFRQYQVAETRLKELCEQQRIELQRAYDDIHPTRVVFNYDRGAIYPESINPEDYAIYLCELKEVHQHFKKWWTLRVETYRQALNRLTEEEKSYLNEKGFHHIQERQNALNRLKNYIEEIIDGNSELNRKAIPVDSVEDVEEADELIEKMSMRELLEDYQDFIGEPEVKEKDKQLSSLPETRPASIYELTITHLSAEELAEYRSGEKGGSKWYTYEDFLQMKKAGMSNKEIAKAMGIEPGLLNKRVKAWKSTNYIQAM